MTRRREQHDVLGRDALGEQALDLADDLVIAGDLDGLDRVDHEQVPGDAAADVGLVAVGHVAAVGTGVGPSGGLLHGEEAHLAEDLDLARGQRVLGVVAGAGADGDLADDLQALGRGHAGDGVEDLVQRLLLGEELAVLETDAADALAGREPSDRASATPERERGNDGERCGRLQDVTSRERHGTSVGLRCGATKWPPL